MNFFDAMKTASVKNKRKAGMRRYISNGEIYLSRLMGYTLVDGIYTPNKSYAPAITLIFEMLASGASLTTIREKLENLKARDSSNNKYSISRIRSIGSRMIYAGYLQNGFRLIKVKNLIPMVSLQVFKEAERNLKREEKKLV